MHPHLWRDRAILRGIDDDYASIVGLRTHPGELGEFGASVGRNTLGDSAQSVFVSPRCSITMTFLIRLRLPSSASRCSTVNRPLLNDAEWVAWSDRKVAEQAGVGVDMVGSIRRQLSENDNSPAATQANKPRTGKDGKTYPAKVCARRRLFARRGGSPRGGERTSPLNMSFPVVTPVTIGLLNNVYVFLL